MPPTFQDRVVAMLKRVPEGMVVTYGILAAYAGNPRAARQVVRILNTQSDKHNLPWHRVINREGEISLKPGLGYELQKAKLVAEGIRFDDHQRVDLSRYLWSPAAKKRGTRSS